MRTTGMTANLMKIGTTNSKGDKHMKTHIYKDNKIFQYGPTTFLAVLPPKENGRTNSSLKRTLEKAKEWIDENLQK